MAKEKSRNRRKRRFYKRKRLWILLLVCMGAGLIGLRVAKERLQPYKEQAAIFDISTIDDVEEPSLICDRKGQVIGRMFVENRSKVPIEEVPQKLIDALIAQEDQRFFEHDGVDRIGVARAIWLNLKAGEVTQGASTITMQLARNAFDLKSVAEDRGQSSMERKIVEAFLALRIEEYLMAEIAGDFPDEEERKSRMKRMVLEYYLNRIPFGTGYYGVRSAALGYFGKEPMALSIEECASLVACVKNPTQISPITNKVKNRKARNHVLNRMLAEEMITDSEWIALSSKPVVVNPKPLRKGKSHLYEIVDDIALEKVGIEAMSRGGFKIYTTIDRDLQEQAEQLSADATELGAEGEHVVAGTVATDGSLRVTVTVRVVGGGGASVMSCTCAFERPESFLSSSGFSTFLIHFWKLYRRKPRERAFSNMYTLIMSERADSCTTRIESRSTWSKSTATSIDMTTYRTISVIAL